MGLAEFAFFVAIGIAAAENMAIRPIIEYQAATAEIAIAMNRTNIPIMIS